MQGAHAVFLATAARLTDAEEEYRQGRNAIAAAQKVYVSSMLAMHVEHSMCIQSVTSLPYDPTSLAYDNRQHNRLSL